MIERDYIKTKEKTQLMNLDSKMKWAPSSGDWKGRGE